MFVIDTQIHSQNNSQCVDNHAINNMGTWMFAHSHLTLSSPYWAAPRLDPLLPHGGVPYTPNVSVSRIFFATTANGTYNHMPMLDEHRGTLFAWWKNSPVDEDQPGQRILYSQSNDGIS